MKDNLASHKAYELIRNDVFEGVLRQGHPIIEEKYSDLLNISRTPIREALRKMESEGLVKTIPRKGSFVRTFEKDEIREIYELIESLEGMAAYLVAENASDKEKQNIKKSIQGMKLAYKNNDTKKWISADIQFHDFLRIYSKNKQLIKLTARLDEQIRLIRIFSMQNAVVDKQKSMNDHALVCDAIMKGEANKARELMQKHLHRIRETILEYL